MLKILVAEDDPNMVSVLTEVLRDERRQVITASSAERAIELVKQDPPDLILADIEMPEGKPRGLELLRQVKDHNRNIPIVMITGNATKDRAIEALRLGAQDFIEKPFRIDELVRRVETALFHQQAVRALQENAELKTQLKEKFQFDNIIGRSASMEAVFRMIRRVANTDSTVLVLGESGTGKELVARALHFNSRRANMPFVAVNCAALPEHLLESELFGHRKGSFTGAAFDKVGLFQHADGGTIFLDEVGSMPLSLQTKLLRFLQDKELRRVGDNDTVKVDVRVVAATNEPLRKKMEDKSFREDLYYRISVIPIELPALRERADDIPLLVQHFVQDNARRNASPPVTVRPEVMASLKGYAWPGNVRELQNAIERACALCDHGVLAVRDLPERVLEALVASDAAPPPTNGSELSPPVVDNLTVPRLQLKDFLHEQEVQYIEHAIRASGGSKERAAELLGISTATLYRKLTANEAAEERD
ncbi:MAG: Regulatory protein AtoC [Verrucomicrobiae bacterium]|nr:Regulatory protein AtoC [Verrucomicrobiae bacterium]